MPIHPTIHNTQLRETMKAEGLMQVNWECLAADGEYFKTTAAPTAGASKTTTITSFTKDYCPLWPVVPVIVVLDDAGDDWSAVSCLVKGVDQFGDAISETAAGSNSSGTWTATCLNAYQTLTSVAITVTGTTTGSDSYTIGYVLTYGLGRKIGEDGDVICSEFDGAADAGTISTAYSTYIIAGTPDGAKAMTFLIRPSYYLR